MKKNREEGFILLDSLLSILLLTIFSLFLSSFIFQLSQETKKSFQYYQSVMMASERDSITVWENLDYE